MSIDDDYPKLSALAKKHAIELDAMAWQTDKGGALVDLRHCCAQIVLNGRKPDPLVPDPHGFLATIEKLLEDFGPRELRRQDLWNKIGKRGSSEFIDTVAEAVIALQLRAVGQKPLLDQWFDPAKKELGNADVVVGHGARRVWCDVYSIDPPKKRGRSAADELALAAVTKYHKKFDKALRAGVVGIAALFICVVKCEDDMAIPFVGSMPSAPPSLWTKCPALDFVYVYSLQKLGLGSDVLVPSTAANWSRPHP